MTAGSILLGLALLVLVALFVARPLWQGDEQGQRTRTDRQRLLDQKEAILAQISALDFDYDTSKLPAEVYQPQRAALVAEAAAILQRLDALPHHDTRDAEIEAAIARLRGQVTVPVNGHGRYCSQCGTPVDPADKFCAHCGHKVTAPISETTAA